MSILSFGLCFAYKLLGSFKTGNFTAQVKPITAEELQELLQSQDHDSEIKGDGLNMSDAEISKLLDRSDLYEKWKKGNEAAINLSSIFCYLLLLSPLQFR